MENIDKILILDFGSQFTQLIARRIRELNVYCEIHPYFYNPSPEYLKNIKGIILSGGPASVTEEGAPTLNKIWLDLNKPILGVCYGMQLLAINLGGQVSQSISREYGHSTLKLEEPKGIFSSFKKNSEINVWMSHGDHVKNLPTGFAPLAYSKDGVLAAMSNEEKKIYAVQFHPEVVHTENGPEILANFVLNVCQTKADWTAHNFLQREEERIRSLVDKDANVICALSGGVDSTVAAVLLHKAIGERLHCIFVDNGLLRANEASEVVKRLGKEGLGLNLHMVDGSKRFLDALKGVTDPEQKRKIIGRLFIELFDEEAHKIKNVTHLVQGTLYPDVIESVSVRGGPSATIKTHHNVGGLPEKMNLKLIEPFRELFKDEVRALGREMNIPEESLKRHPFPGPGLAVRILGEITPERLSVLRQADQIFIEQIQEAGIYSTIWQAFAVLLPIKSVGVMGDSRTYEEVISLRAVYSEDGMTADWCYLPHDLLRRVSNRIINEVRGINRVVYDISSKPPATIEWE